MVFSILVFGVALLTLRRRPWSPHLSSWVTVGICATAGGALLGVAFDKLVVESLGVGGWTVGILLFGAAVLSPLIVANTVMYGRNLPTFLELLGRATIAPRHVCKPFWYRAARHHGSCDADCARFCVRSALS
jgi:hypothetical protein